MIGAVQEDSGAAWGHLAYRGRTRLKCRIDRERSPYPCVLSEHKPVRRGREMIDLIAVEGAEA